MCFPGRCRDMARTFRACAGWSSLVVADSFKTIPSSWAFVLADVEKRLHSDILVEIEDWVALPPPLADASRSCDHEAETDDYKTVPASLSTSHMSSWASTMLARGCNFVVVLRHGFRGLSPLKM